MKTVDELKGEIDQTKEFSGSEAQNKILRIIAEALVDIRVYLSRINNR